MKPAQFSPGGPSDSLDASTRHAFGARFAARQIVRAKAQRDPELATLYQQLAIAHLDRHLAQLRRRLP